MKAKLDQKCSCCALPSHNSRQAMWVCVSAGFQQTPLVGFPTDTAQLQCLWWSIIVKTTWVPPRHTEVSVWKMFFGELFYQQNTHTKKINIVATSRDVGVNLFPLVKWKRGNSLKLQEGRFRLGIRRNFLMEWVIKYWNSLLMEVTKSPMLDIFKRHRDAVLSNIV